MNYTIALFLGLASAARLRQTPATTAGAADYGTAGTAPYTDGSAAGTAPYTDGSAAGTAQYDTSTATIASGTCYDPATYTYTAAACTQNQTNTNYQNTNDNTCWDEGSQTYTAPCGNSGYESPAQHASPQPHNTDQQDEMSYERVKEEFNKVDTDGNGTLSPAEVVGTLETFVPNLDERQIYAQKLFNHDSAGANLMEFQSWVDTNSDGKIDINEFFEVYKAFSQGHNPDGSDGKDAHQEMFGKIDRNGDNKIDMEEASYYIANHIPAEGQQETMKHVFKDGDESLGFNEWLDPNQDGTVDAEEFRKASNGEHHNGDNQDHADAGMKKFFTEIDTNGDGQLDFAEFGEFVQKHVPAEYQEPLRQMVLNENHDGFNQQYDNNGNNQIGWEEFRTIYLDIANKMSGGDGSNNNGGDGGNNNDGDHYQGPTAQEIWERCDYDASGMIDFAEASRCIDDFVYTRAYHEAEKEGNEIRKQIFNIRFSAAIDPNMDSQVEVNELYNYMGEELPCDKKCQKQKDREQKKAERKAAKEKRQAERAAKKAEKAAKKQAEKDAKKAAE